ncbi:MAG: G5 domain-containing protein [Oscillospiraceae bacterium]|nr:G5 domain-containing protein [Oscillospiraceae bacterium]
MKVTFQRKVLNVIRKVKSKKNILKNHTVFGLLLGFASVSIMFLLTGVVYFRNEARIYVGGEAIRAFTMYDELEDILAEQEITVGEYDRVDFGGVIDGEADIVIHRSLNIPVIVDDDIVYVECAYDETVQDVIDRSGIELDPQDVVAPSEDTVCAELTTVEVYRSYPVYIKADGETIELYAYEQTVQTLLDRAEITLEQDDYIDLDPETVLAEGETVTVTRVRYETVETYEVVPYDTVTQRSNLVPLNTSEVIQEGVNGTRTNTSLVKYVDGVRESETALSSEITAWPVDEIISVGAALTVPYSKKDPGNLVLENGLPVNYETILTGKSCAYTAPIGSGTASGRKLEIGTVAVDPAIIPYGSELYIVSTDGSYVYGYAIAADTGNLTAAGVLVDLYMGNMEDYYWVSVQYGAKQVNIYVLSWGN